MDQDLKSRWIAALRSGKYNQITSKLRNTHGHCCLGVLCEVADISIYESGVYLKITDIINHRPAEIYAMNDGIDGVRQRSFSEIADWIEVNL